MNIFASIRNILAIVLLIVFADGLAAQDFGFGFDDGAEETDSAPAVSVKVGGEIAVELAPYVHDFDKKGGCADYPFGIWPQAMSISALQGGI